MRLKRFLLPLLLAGTTLVLTACGNASSGSDNDSASGKEADTTKTTTETFSLPYREDTSFADLPSDLAPAKVVGPQDHDLPLDRLWLPKGFTVEVYVSDIENARSMARGDEGTLFVGTRSKGNVYAVLDRENDLTPDTTLTIAKGLKMPNGVALHEGDLYLAEIDKVWRYPDIEASLPDIPEPELVSDQFPSDEHHGWKHIAFGPDDKLYVPVGAPCNICEKEDTVYSTIMRMNPDGSQLEVYAHGVRNSVGFDWHPETQALWFTDNGRDRMGDNVPRDELNRAPQKGMHFGYPYCHAGDVPDPEFGAKRSCEEFIAPAQKMAPHTAALGIEFYTGDHFPAGYKQKAFVAEHGSWNRSVPIGYRVTNVTIEKGQATAYEVFATGWLKENGKPWGRPVDVLELPDGSLLVSDDYGDAIYRIRYEG